MSYYWGKYGFFCDFFHFCNTNSFNYYNFAVESLYRLSYIRSRGMPSCDPFLIFLFLLKSKLKQNFKKSVFFEKWKTLICLCVGILHKTLFIEFNKLVSVGARCLKYDYFYKKYFCVLKEDCGISLKQFVLIQFVLCLGERISIFMRKTQNNQFLIFIS